MRTAFCRPRCRSARPPSSARLLSEIANSQVSPTSGARAAGMVGIHFSAAAPSPLADFTVASLTGRAAAGRDPLRPFRRRLRDRRHHALALTPPRTMTGLRDPRRRRRAAAPRPARPGAPADHLGAARPGRAGARHGLPRPRLRQRRRHPRDRRESRSGRRGDRARHGRGQARFRPWPGRGARARERRVSPGRRHGMGRGRPLRPGLQPFPPDPSARAGERPGGRSGAPCGPAAERSSKTSISGAISPTRGTPPSSATSSSTARWWSAAAPTPTSALGCTPWPGRRLGEPGAPGGAAGLRRRRRQDRSAW